MIAKTRGGTHTTGKLPRGCELCMEGAKMVLFATGFCSTGCYYCPISFKRRDSRQAWANERPISAEADIIEEARRMDAKGASITGGEPALEMERSLGYIRLLKKEQGKRFHMHLYTYSATPEQVKAFAGAGLDEIRFHNPKTMLASAHLADKLDMGCEVPCIPGNEESLKQCVDLIAGKAKFLNLNELEFSESNCDALKAKGFALKHELSHAAKGSEELGMKILDYAGGRLDTHFCTSSFKDSVQYRNRLIRTAENMRKPFEKISPDGLLLKGTIKPKDPSEDLGKLKEKLLKRYSLAPDFLWIDMQKKRLETSVPIAKRLAKNKELQAEIVEEFPTWDRYEAETTPLF